jgi:2-haloacid dehalogenase
MPRRARWATFDCYGTLIDWNGGIRGVLERLWPEGDTEGLLERYHELEPDVQRASQARSYRQVLASCLRSLADEAGLSLSARDEGALGDSLPGWPEFPEVHAALAELREQGWKLAILSNTDPDLLRASLEWIGVPFEELVIASEIGSYKPAYDHWRVFFERSCALPEEHVHVAASLFHDIRPATDLGLRTVWINRLGETADPVPTRELPDLARLPETLAELVPSQGL